MKRSFLPSLFDPPVLDPDLARINRNAGINQAADHANQVDDHWTQKAYDQLLDFLAIVSGSFMGEDIRTYANKKGLPSPPTNRAWGAVITRAQRENLIRKIGIRSTQNQKAHRANAAVWERL